MSKTKYKLVNRGEGYNEIATTDLVIEYMVSNPDYMGKVVDSRDITMKEINSKQIRIYSEKLHIETLERDIRRERILSWAASVKQGTVDWFDKVRGKGMITCNGERLPIYACNIKGKKTWYPETACVYYEKGQVVDCKIEVHSYHDVFAIGLTPGHFDSEGWDRIKDKRLAFVCNEEGKPVNGLFGKE